MQTKPCLAAADFKQILEAAQVEATGNGWKVSIAVVDDGGHLLGFVRLDGAPPLSVAMSQAKAHTAAMGRRESKFYEDMIANGRVAFLSAPGQFGLLEGGVPIVVDGQAIGAVGVSGVASADDAKIAMAGIAALAA